MSRENEPVDLFEVTRTRVNAILDALLADLDVGLSADQEQRILAALAEAINAGVRIGASEAAAAINEQRPDVNVRLEIEERED